MADPCCFLLSFVETGDRRIRHHSCGRQYHGAASDDEAGRASSGAVALVSVESGPTRFLGRTVDREQGAEFEEPQHSFYLAALRDQQSHPTAAAVGFGSERQQAPRAL